MNPDQLLRRISRGEFQNVSFGDVQRLVEALGFRLERTRGSHRMYQHPHVPVPLNLQPRAREAKAYQLRELLSMVEEYDLHLEERR